jgi:transcriptional repressor NrdR
MHCPFCSSPSTRVVDKRDNTETNVTRRRRECEECEKRFTTYERVETLNLFVIKRSGKIEEFDREKLKRGINKAIGKKRVPEVELENLIQRIEQALLNHESTEIKSTEIGQMVLDELFQIDELSYLLFASVYKDFQNLSDLKKAISTVETKRTRPVRKVDAD